MRLYRNTYNILQNAYFIYDKKSETYNVISTQKLMSTNFKDTLLSFLKQFVANFLFQAIIMPLNCDSLLRILICPRLYKYIIILIIIIII